jgi:hypothetical protein
MSPFWVFYPFSPLMKNPPQLGDRPTQANDIIKFLNSKTREELEELKIEDRT